MNPDNPQIMAVRRRFGIIGSSPELLRAIDRAVRVAPIDLSVLVTGESGSGKEFFPQIIHSLSPRKHARYIAVNCGAIPEGTIDSELFGHEKGAFTGAVASRKGYFEEADGGTIFLDEVAELPLTTQARLLRVLETGEFLKVGSSVVQKVNVRIVAATNVNLPKAIEEGRFREDLFYRLSTISISVPPLRERDADIPLLARKFAADFAEKYTMPQVSFDESARALFMAYRWPGNVRQLKNVVEQIALFHPGENLSAAEVREYLPTVSMEVAPLGSETPHTYAAERDMLLGMIFRLQSQIDELRRHVPSSPQPAPAAESRPAEPSVGSAIVPFTPVIPAINLPDASQFQEVTPVATLEQTERDTIMRALERNGGRRKATAAELNISERTLYRKIKEYGME